MAASSSSSHPNGASEAASVASVELRWQGARRTQRRAWACFAGNGAKTIVVESPDRFARDLAVQLAGHDMLKSLGIAIIPASAPDFFTEDTPTAVLVRQVLGAIAQFEKASIVAKTAPAAAQGWATVVA